MEKILHFLHFGVGTTTSPWWCLKASKTNEVGRFIYKNPTLPTLPTLPKCKCRIKTLGFAQTHEGMIPSTSLSNSPFPLKSLRGTSFAKKQAGERQTMNVCHPPARRLSVLSFRQGQLLRYHSLRSFLMLAASLDFIRSLSLEVVIFFLQVFKLFCGFFELVAFFSYLCKGFLRSFSEDDVRLA